MNSLYEQIKADLGYLRLDDVGPIPLRTGAEAAWFFEVVNTRYNKGHPTIVTTNRGLLEWAASSATPSSPPPSWTGSCTTPSCSTSAAPAGAHANTTDSKSPPPNPPTTRPANLTSANQKRPPRREFRLAPIATSAER